MEQQHGAGGYGALVYTMPAAAVCWRLDGDLTILAANDRFYRGTGYTEPDFRGRFPTLRAYYTDAPQDWDGLLQALAPVLDQGAREVEHTLRLPRKDGADTWVQVSGTVLPPAEGEPPALLAVLTDVTALVRQREDLAVQFEKKSANFQWMMDEYVGNVYVCDMETYELLYLNPNACATLQHTKEELVGRKCYEVIQGRTSPCPFCTNDRICEEEVYAWEFDNPVLERTFKIKNRVILWNGRRARIELSHDMYSTEYKLAKKDQEREAILKTIPGGFVRLDARDEHTVLWYSETFLDMIGYTKEQFETELHSQCGYVHPDDMARALSLMENARQTGQSEIMEARILTRSGEERIMTITLCYVSAADSWDGLPSFYSVGIDVTRDRMEQLRQRRALEDAYQAAKVANEAKTNFLSSMSHDIRTPMNAIMGMAAIAQASLSAPDKVHDCLNKISTSSRHLLSLINEVLDMSRIESGKIDLMPEEVDLPELIQSVADMCRPLLEEKRQNFHISVGMVRHEQVVADGDRLKQVLMNLLSNAIKYTPEGGDISLRIQELPAQVPQRGQYEFIFTDNGIGMSEDYLPHIFEPFSRAEDSRISKIQGTGLGMTITENIVRMMNGTIEVSSTLGRGSRFVVSVPLELQDKEEDREAELVGCPVLVVDDDQVVCESAVALLQELGMRGCWVLSGPEAVLRVSEAHDRADDFFAVILDWKMPGMDGLETLKAIRARLGEDVPIIIISAYDYSAIEEEFLRAGADAFITKPLFKSKMLHVLQLFCGSRPDAGRPSPAAPRTALHGKRVLLVEDNELNREIALELLEMQGLAVDTAENGRLAVERFSASAPGGYDAILMDIQMPVMNGYEATAAIRALDRPDAATVPILALTANAFTADVSQARSVGMNDHIAKPIDLDRLLDTLQRWIGV